MNIAAVGRESRLRALIKQKTNPMTITETLFRLGRIVATPGALEALARAGQDAISSKGMHRGNGVS